ncbi:helix-turn-helix transcriptional regulator [Enterobacter sp. CC120223-11]|uniref:helix-turn-helix domain-containing protein n=1 Tax=Enterobacter sp. CC120223-11 TaxID=1378073 RepID=UPI000BD17BFB|nr:helix-turn-helix transcriptional regulator [Enterobacter sp. CC120223-11]SNY70188.1 Response regulator containing a CheY-like receiver domain and an HTH DNA-binding domain [Enterobacter sp. CC120223-11]
MNINGSINSVSLYVISKNHFLRTGWLAFINEMQPIILAKTDKICDIHLLDTLNAGHLKEISQQHRCGILIDREMAAELTEYLASHRDALKFARVFIINDIRNGKDLPYNSLPFKPALSEIKKILLQAMSVDYTDVCYKNDASPVHALSDQDRDFLRLIVEGESIKDISDRLNTPYKSVYTWRARLFTKLGVCSLYELIQKKEILKLS